MAIPSLTLRATKGSALTFAEADTNFQNLANIAVGVTAGGTTSNVALNGASGAPTAITFANSATVQATQSSGTITLTSNITPFTHAFTSNVQGNGQYLQNIIFDQYREKIANVGPFTGTLTINANTAPVQTGAVTGSITLNTNNITNLIAGESVTLLLYQTGNYTLTSNLKFVQGTKTISTTAGNVDAITIFYDGTSYIAGLARYF
jgi:hypothetical protein